MVIKKDGSKELYDRDKLKKAIMLAFAKRKTIDIEQIHNIITSLEIERLKKWNEITSVQIGEDVVEALKDIDFVAYIRFASVYKAFDTSQDFQTLLSNS